MLERKSWIAISMLVVVSLLVAACGPTPTPEPTEAPVEEPTEAPTEEPATAPAEAPEKELEGQTVSVTAVWGGDEQESFMAMVEPWEEKTGAKVEYEGTRDLNAVLTTRVEGGNPPDIAGLPGPRSAASVRRGGTPGGSEHLHRYGGTEPGL